jgi:hypothetical protein
MAKNKKRKKNPSAQAVQQSNLSRHKSEVMENLSYLCFMIGGHDLFSLIPQKYKDAVYATRGTLQVVSGYRKKIQKRLAEVMTKELREEMHYHRIEVIKDGHYAMSLSDFLMVGIPLYLILQDEKHCYFKGKERFECFYKNNGDVKELFIEEVKKLVPLYCDFYSDLKRRIMYDFWMRTKIYYPHPDDRSTYRFTLQIVIEPITLEAKPIRINNETHLGTPVLYIERRPEYKQKRETGEYMLVYHISMKHKYFDPRSSFPELPIEVYIQQHAVERLMERTCCPFPHWIYDYLVDALLKPTVIRMQENRYLIEYRMVGIKIGYFLTTLVNGELLIRTFLFITHNGTPEGRKLEASTGLQKEDRKYLSIDNIRALANSDIEQNVTMHKLFLQAGLGSLLELCKRVREKDKDFLWLISESENKTSLSRLIIEYMKSDADNDEFVEVED